jgi:hypothetical protein
LRFTVREMQPKAGRDDLREWDAWELVAAQPAAIAKLAKYRIPHILPPASSASFSTRSNRGG